MPKICLLLSKPGYRWQKALYNAVIKGVLTLEGEGKYVSLFMETMNYLNRMFTKKKTEGAGCNKAD
jgi:hypothetical protein